MLERLFYDQVWVAMVAVAALMFTDYRLTLAGERWHQRGADEHYVLDGGYELNPAFSHDVEEMRPLSPRHLLMTALACALVLGAWALSRVLDLEPDLYLAVVGFVILPQAPAQLGHLRNIALFSTVARHGGVAGRIRTERWLEQRMGAVLLGLFAGLYALLFVLVGHALFLGGAIGCAAIGSLFWALSKHPEVDGERAPGEP